MGDDARAALAAALLSEFERMPVEFGLSIEEIATECADGLLAMPGWRLVPDDAVPVDAERLAVALDQLLAHYRRFTPYEAQDRALLERCDAALAPAPSEP